MRTEDKIALTAAWIGVFLFAGLVILAVYGMGVFIASRAPLI